MQEYCSNLTVNGKTFSFYDFEEINIDEQPEKIDYVKSLGFTAAPVIEAGDIVFSGFQPTKLKEIL